MSFLTRFLASTISVGGLLFSGVAIAYEFMALFYLLFILGSIAYYIRIGMGWENESRD